MEKNIFLDIRSLNARDLEIFVMFTWVSFGDNFQTCKFELIGYPKGPAQNIEAVYWKRARQHPTTSLGQQCFPLKKKTGGTRWLSFSENPYFPHLAIPVVFATAVAAALQIAITISAPTIMGAPLAVDEVDPASQENIAGCVLSSMPLASSLREREGPLVLPLSQS